MKRLLSSILFITMASGASAATVVWNAATDNGLALAGGETLLPTNSLIRLGYFNVDTSLIQANALNVPYLDANFVQLDFDRIGIGSQSGLFQDSININPAGIVGKQLVFWAFHSSDNSSVASSISTATQIGIFFLEDNTWKIQSDDPTPSLATLDISDLTGDGPTANLLPNARVLVGSYTNNTAGPFGARNFALAVVPEPSTAIAALLGGSALLLRRRRRN